MARKLGLGGRLTIVAALCVAGCQTGTGTRLGSNKTSGPALASRQGNVPPPPSPTPASTTFRNVGNNVTPSNFSTSTQNGFPTSPNMGPLGDNPAALPSTPNTTPLNQQAGAPFPPPPGPQGIGTPTTTNRNVNVTSPEAPLVPPPLVPPPQPQFAQPGISPIR